MSRREHRGQHIYLAEQVDVDANGNPYQIHLRNPYGSEVIISADLFFFCSGGFAAFTV
jgi:hypothetical protein